MDRDPGWSHWQQFRELLSDIRRSDQISELVGLLEMDFSQLASPNATSHRAIPTPIPQALVEDCIAWFYRTRGCSGRRDHTEDIADTFRVVDRDHDGRLKFDEFAIAVFSEITPPGVISGNCERIVNRTVRRAKRQVRFLKADRPPRGWLDAKAWQKCVDSSMERLVGEEAAMRRQACAAFFIQCGRRIRYDDFFEACEMGWIPDYIATPNYASYPSSRPRSSPASGPSALIGDLVDQGVQGGLALGFRLLRGLSSRRGARRPATTATATDATRRSRNKAPSGGEGESQRSKLSPPRSQSEESPDNRERAKSEQNRALEEKAFAHEGRDGQDREKASKEDLVYLQAVATTSNGPDESSSALDGESHPEKISVGRRATSEAESHSESIAGEEFGVKTSLGEGSSSGRHANIEASGVSSLSSTHAFSLQVAVEQVQREVDEEVEEEVPDEVAGEAEAPIAHAMEQSPPTAAMVIGRPGFEGKIQSSHPRLMHKIPLNFWDTLSTAEIDMMVRSHFDSYVIGLMVGTHFPLQQAAKDLSEMTWIAALRWTRGPSIVTVPADAKKIYLVGPLDGRVERLAGILRAVLSKRWATADGSTGEEVGSASGRGNKIAKNSHTDSGDNHKGDTSLANDEAVPFRMEPGSCIIFCGNMLPAARRSKALSPTDCSSILWAWMAVVAFCNMYPETVYLIRGRLESEYSDELQWAGRHVFGFDEAQQLWNPVIDSCELMPLGAVQDDWGLCIFGGSLTDSIRRNFDSLFTVRRPISLNGDQHDDEPLWRIIRDAYGAERPTTGADDCLATASGDHSFLVQRQMWHYGLNGPEWHRLHLLEVSRDVMLNSILELKCVQHWC